MSGGLLRPPHGCLPQCIPVAHGTTLQIRTIEFMVGIGGIADTNGRIALANSVEFDPFRSLAGSKSRTAASP